MNFQMKDFAQGLRNINRKKKWEKRKENLWVNPVSSRDEKGTTELKGKFLPHVLWQSLFNLF